MKHLYRHLTWLEVKKAARKGAVIIIPVSAIEQHGYHLPVDTDNLAVEHVTEQAALRSDGVILTAPVIHYGFNEHNMGFPGTINVRDSVLLDFYYDVGHSFVRQGFDRILFVNGHGSNQMLCNLAARRIINETDALAASCAYWSMAREVVDQLRESKFPGGMAHAGEFETSIYLHLRPELVGEYKELPGEAPSRLNRFIYDDLFGSGPVHFVNRWSRVTESGVEGEPGLASAEKGKRFLESAIENLIEFCRLFREMKKGEDRDYNWRPEGTSEVK